MQVLKQDNHYFDATAFSERAHMCLICIVTLEKVK